MTTRTTRRPTQTPATTPVTDRRTVEGMLHEIAYVLHATRKLSAPTAWPAAPRSRTAEDVRVTASA